MNAASMNIEFTGKIWHWRGLAPFYFVTYGWAAMQPHFGRPTLRRPKRPCTSVYSDHAAHPAA